MKVISRMSKKSWIRKLCTRFVMSIVVRFHSALILRPAAR